MPLAALCRYLRPGGSEHWQRTASGTRRLRRQSGGRIRFNGDVKTDQATGILGLHRR
jgi:hypothetical protein